MTLEQFRHICRVLKAYGAYIGFISGGEALLVPHLDAILLEARKTFQLATTLVTGLYHKSDVIRRIGHLALEHNINIQTSLDGLGKTGDDLRGVPDFAESVLGAMSMLSELRNEKRSGSLLYANIVLNNLNLDQVVDLIKRARDLDWRVTIGLYHSLTTTTQHDDELIVTPGKRLDKLLAYLDNNPDILNLPSYIRGIGPFLEGRAPRICAFTDTNVLATRTTIMENGELHLCYGGPVGNLFQNSLQEIFTSEAYNRLMSEYRSCPGCWTTCYTQRALLVRPRSARELWENVRQLRKLK